LSKNNNTLRITGGHHRSRQVCFIPVYELRPTSERIRETLFSWLGSQICQYKVLDLFAGSGILGLEALSRGAVEVFFVDKSRVTVQQLQHNIEKLNITQRKAVVFHSNAFKWLRDNKSYIDLVFLDPPFSGDLLSSLLDQLHSFECLKNLKWIYLEQSNKKDWPALPEDWYWYRQKVAGQVKFALLGRQKDI
jgi:16S rRNA (guanine966-N2)-methyltransferase